jgi:hypothetical protein
MLLLDQVPVAHALFRTSLIQQLQSMEDGTMRKRFTLAALGVAATMVIGAGSAAAQCQANTGYWGGQGYGYNSGWDQSAWGNTGYGNNYGYTQGNWSGYSTPRSHAMMRNSVRMRGGAGYETSMAGGGQYQVSANTNTRGAYDNAHGYANQGYNYGSNYANQAYNTGSNWGNQAYNNTANYANQGYNYGQNAYGNYDASGSFNASYSGNGNMGIGTSSSGGYGASFGF